MRDLDANILAEMPVHFSDVEAAAKRNKGIVTHTPLIKSVELDRLTGGNIYVKAECLQLSGSFKFRGAFNRVSQLSDEEKTKGVVAWSSGNHGQGVALAAKMAGVKATIVMPQDAPAIKVEKTRSHGADIIFFDRKSESREEISKDFAQKTGAVIIPSYDDVYIISGQGTSGYEACQDLKALDITPDAYIINVGGGGLTAGCSLAIHHFFPDTLIYTAEPASYDDHKRSFETGSIQKVTADATDSFCDALLSPCPGDMTFAINRHLVSGGLAVTDDEVSAAIKFAFNNLKVVAEPGGAVALAAILSGKIDCKGKTIVATISGGNIDADLFLQCLNS